MAAIHSITFRIKSWTPLIMHAARLLDPNDPLKVEMDLLTGKKAKEKTVDDFARIKDVEWMAGIYSNQEGRPIIPGANIEGMFVDSAMKLRKGPTYKIGLSCTQDSLLIYDGPKHVKELIKDLRFRDVRRAVIPGRGSSVMRCRPIFVQWALEFRIDYIPEILHGDEIIERLDYAGVYVGICDYTPKYGRFTVESYKANPPIAPRQAADAKPKAKKPA